MTCAASQFAVWARFTVYCKAFPLTAGKDAFDASSPPPESQQKQGWKVWTIGDDIAWMRKGPDGRLWAIKEKAALYAAYIPLFTEGGIFIPTAREYKLGDDIYVLLSLPEDPQRYPYWSAAPSARPPPLEPARDVGPPGRRC